MKALLLVVTCLSLTACGTGKGQLLSQETVYSTTGPANYQAAASCLFDHYQADSALADIRKTDLVSPTRSVVSKEERGITMWTAVVTPNGSGSRVELTEIVSVLGRGIGMTERKATANACAGN